MVGSEVFDWTSNDIWDLDLISHLPWLLTDVHFLHPGYWAFFLMQVLFAAGTANGTFSNHYGLAYRYSEINMNLIIIVDLHK